MTEKFTFFWGGVFSQWHKCKFTDESMGITFNCAEQYMMYCKAVIFCDMETAKEILKSTNPRDQKALGRRVRGFKKDIWDQHCRLVVYRANHLKFSQNPSLLKALMATDGTTLVEASPKDTIWGIGLTANDPRALDRSKWLGTNWLGEALTRVRGDLKREALKNENCGDKKGA